MAADWATSRAGFPPSPVSGASSSVAPPGHDETAPRPYATGRRESQGAAVHPDVSRAQGFRRPRDQGARLDTGAAGVAVAAGDVVAPGVGRAEAAVVRVHLDAYVAVPLGRMQVSRAVIASALAARSAYGSVSVPAEWA